MDSRRIVGGSRRNRCHYTEKIKRWITIGSKKQSLSTPKPLPEITMDDVGGLQTEIKQEILQTLTTLKEPERSAKIGIKPPQGILLYGPPGTGKRCLPRQSQRAWFKLLLYERFGLQRNVCWSRSSPCPQSFPKCT